MSLLMPERDQVLAAHIAGVLTDIVEHAAAGPSSRRPSPLPDARAGSRARDELGVDRDQLKAALGTFGSGVTIVTGMHDGAPAGFTCQSFFSVSLEPPLVALSVMSTSTTYPTIRDAHRIAISVLAEDQRELSNQFARSGTDKWAGVEWAATPGGAPVIAGCVSWFECEIESEIEAGDHIVVIARVTALRGSQDARPPLMYWSGGYQRFEA